MPCAPVNVSKAVCLIVMTSVSKSQYECTKRVVVEVEGVLGFALRIIKKTVKRIQNAVDSMVQISDGFRRIHEQKSMETKLLLHENSERLSQSFEPIGYHLEPFGI